MKKPEEIKKVTPKCPWCGAEMRFDADSIHVWFKCDNCLAASPKAYRIWDTGLKTAENWAVNESIALDRIQQLEAQVPKWISAKTPPKDWRENDKDKTLINYQVYSPDYGVDIGNWIETAKMWVIMGLPAKVTHWMPLPEAPKEDAKQ